MRADPRRGDLGDAVGAIGEPDLVDQDELEDDPEPDRRHGQVVAGQFEGGNAQQDPEEGRHEEGGEHPRPYGQAELGGENGRGVGPHSPKRRLRQRQLTRVSQDDVQSQAGHRKTDGQIDQVHPVVARHQTGENQNEQRPERQERAVFLCVWFIGAPSYAFSAIFSPKNPCGRRRRTRIRMMKAKASR